MSTGLPVFDKSIQDTNLWLKGIERELGDASRHNAYSALRAVLHALRDRLPPEAAMHFAAQLPMLVRGLYAEGWRLAGKPTGERTREEFADRVYSELPPAFPHDASVVVRAVFCVIEERTSVEEASKLRALLPDPIKKMWTLPVEL
ncbi:MAG: DUF2267 domain-containing protein [Hyphomonadaceae bacterium]